MRENKKKEKRERDRRVRERRERESKDGERGERRTRVRRERDSNGVHISHSVCDSLSSYISLVNNFRDQITPYWSILIDYPHQHID